MCDSHKAKSFSSRDTHALKNVAVSQDAPQRQ